MPKHSIRLSRESRLGYRIESRAATFRLQGIARNVCLLKSIQTGNVTRLASYSVHAADLSPGKKRPGREGDYILPPSDEVKNEWSCYPHYVMACTMTCPSLEGNRSIAKSSRWCARNLMFSTQQSPSSQPDSRSCVRKIDDLFMEPGGLLPYSQQTNIQLNKTQLNPISNLVSHIQESTLKLVTPLHQRLDLRSYVCLYTLTFLK